MGRVKPIKYSNEKLENFKPLVTFFQFFCILPPYDFEKKSFKTGKCYKYLAIFYCITVIILMFANLSVLYSEPVVDYIYRFFHFCSVFSGHTNILCIIYVSLSRTNDWSKLFQAFYFLESTKCFNICNERRSPIYYNRTVQLIACNLVFFGLIVGIHLRWFIDVSEGKVPLKFVLCYMELNSLVIFYIVMSTFIKCQILALLKVRYQDLEKMMRRFQIAEYELWLSSIRKIEILYYHLQQIVFFYNRLFRGQHWLMIAFGFVLTIFYCLYLNNYPHRTTDVLIMVISVTPSLVSIYFCDITKKEQEKIIALSLALQRIVPEDSIYHRELQYLTVKMKSLSREFSAGGYFHINRTLLLSICGSLATYFIALQQIWSSRINSLAAFKVWVVLKDFNHD